MGKQFSVGMEGEKDTGGKAKVPEGEQRLIIKSVLFVSDEESGSGKAYFKWTLETEDGEAEITTVTTLIKGKRWLLKQLLSACGVSAEDDDPDKRYQFDEEDVLERPVIAIVKHEPNEFTNKAGEKIKHKKPVVKAFKKAEGTSPAKEKEEIAF